VAEIPAWAGGELPPLPDNFATPAVSPNNAAKLASTSSGTTRTGGNRYAYYRMVEDVDRQIGQVLAALRKSGQGITR